MQRAVVFYCNWCALLSSHLLTQERNKAKKAAEVAAVKANATGWSRNRAGRPNVGGAGGEDGKQDDAPLLYVDVNLTPVAERPPAH